ncbi:uncharacterized protein LOC143055540 isoform X2 [Mytilus galloprovincialis]|uniref:uncharacterized protein LOC143055540 isoform X2 n=1 Tax=Mytilus galloprovincialis TaxID=29158 RepID=UPI003F7CB7EC
MELFKLTVYIVIYFLLHIYPVAETSISYYDTKLTWIEARDFCFNQSGILESNHTEITALLGNKTEDVWTGTYTTWSEWAAIWDCNVHPATVSAVFKDGDYSECQRFCQATEYFGYNGSFCYCMDKPRVSTLFTFCKSFPKEFIKVYKQNITGVKAPLLYTPVEELRCMSAQCQDGDILLRSENCRYLYEGICDFGISAGTYTMQTDAANLCNNSGSFLKWYDKSFCSTGKKNQLWTSATRDTYTKDLLESDKGLSFNPLLCQYMDMNNSLVRSDKCIDTRTFMCRFEKIEVTTVPIVNKTQTTRDTDTTGTIMLMFILIGSLSLVVLVILAIFLYKFSKSDKKNKVGVNFNEDSNENNSVNGTIHPSHHIDTENFKGISTENSLKRNMPILAIGGEGETKESRDDYDDIENKVCFNNSVTQKDKKQKTSSKQKKIKNSQTQRHFDNYDDMEDKIGGSKPGSEKSTNKCKEIKHKSNPKKSIGSESYTDIEENIFNKKIEKETVYSMDTAKIIEGQELRMDVDYDEIEDSNNVSVPSTSKNVCADELRPKGYITMTNVCANEPRPKGYTTMKAGNVSKDTLHSGIFTGNAGKEGSDKHGFCTNVPQNFTKLKRSEFSIPVIDDEYAEIEDTGESVYSSASLIGDDSDENKFIESDNQAKTAVNSNTQSTFGDDEYAELEAEGDSVYSSASHIDDESGAFRSNLTKSENTANTSVNSNIQTTYDVVSHPVYAVSSKSSSNVKSMPDLVTEPLISTNTLPKASPRDFGLIAQPGSFAVQAKVSNEKQQIHMDCDVNETFYDELHTNRLEENKDQSIYDQSMNLGTHGEDTVYDKLHGNSLKESENSSADYDHV